MVLGNEGFQGLFLGDIPWRELKNSMEGTVEEESIISQERKWGENKNTAEKKFQYSVCQRKAIYYILTELVKYLHNATGTTII